MIDATTAGGAAAGTITVERTGPRDFRMSASGLWTVPYADAHFGHLERTLAIARRSGGVRVLVDLREAAVQTADTAARVAFWTQRIYRADDRVAMLVSSSLVNMQMRRVAIIATRELFISESAAETWLRAG